MREIKFRYWNSVTNIYVDEPRMPFKDGWTITELFSERGWIWLQYTGLKDKNGVEIYEWDIIANKLNPKGYHIKDLEDAFDFWLSREAMSHSTDWEVIGNIYQNPELLT